MPAPDATLTPSVPVTVPPDDWLGRTWLLWLLLLLLLLLIAALVVTGRRYLRSRRRR